MAFLSRLARVVWRRGCPLGLALALLSASWEVSLCQAQAPFRDLYGTAATPAQRDEPLEEEWQSWFPGRRTSLERDPSLFVDEGTGATTDLVECRSDPPELAPDPDANPDSLFDPADALEGVAGGDDSLVHVISFRQDARELPWMLWNDALSLFTWRNAFVIGIAAGGAIAVRDNLDQRVRRETAEHPLRWGEGSKVLRDFGEYSYQVPVLAGVYGLSLWIDDDRLHEFSKAAISAYALNAIVTVSIKGITNTQRPTDQFQNGHYGFPSHHSSSTFAIAAVLDEYYGWPVGVPSYILAGLVGWSRIDQREHDLSDVLFGSVLGFVIGKTVAAAHLDRYSSITVLPYYDPVCRASGLSFEMRF